MSLPRGLLIFALTLLPEWVSSGGIWISAQGCGVKKGCVLWPANCRELGCEILFTFEEAITKDVVHFELQAKSTGWVAVGFSYDMHMGHDDVYSCVNVNGTVHLRRSYNQQHRNYNQDLYGVSHEEGFYADGFISCRFTRTKDVQQLDVNMFGFFQAWYLLLPSGPVDIQTGKMKPHIGMPVVSSIKVLLSQTQHEFIPAEIAHDAQHSYLRNGTPSRNTMTGRVLLLIGCLLFVINQ
ncbi:DOMON domain-containing protein FRRS1L-like [Ptychodera flava]|uniref:DOMON domain-containing protein FRRS1L-like n=1 Tax=Ptychodera flava TaxID=63121 RepID=UPI003969D153